jgi:hypothetical protein
MSPSKKHVFITEPSWFEKPIPRWVNGSKHVIISDSECVILKAHRKNIDCIAMKSYLSAKDLYMIDKTKLECERTIISTLKKRLGNFSHFSGLLQGVSLFASFATKINLSLEKIIESNNVQNVTLVKGSRFGAMPYETPRGGFLTHYLLSKLCKNKGISYSLANHQIENFLESQKSNRYDKSFNLIKDFNTEVLKFNNRNQTASQVLFLYCYDMCSEDLEPLLKQHESVFKGVIGEWAPRKQNYNFNFLKHKKNKNLTFLNFDKEMIQIFKKAIKPILDPNHFEEHHLEKILSKLTSSFASECKSIETIINNISERVQEYNIHTIYLTAFPSPLQSVIAQFFYNNGINVNMRQHGALTDHFFHERCFVEGPKYITNSPHVIPSHYPGEQEKLDFISRERKTLNQQIDSIKDQSKLIKILISDDLYFDSAEYKIDNIIFLENFFNTIPQSFNLTLRSHPRYGAQSFSESQTSNFNIENSKKISAQKSLSSSSICLIPHQAISSLVCDAIAANVPVILFLPRKSYAQFSFAVTLWNFPTVVSSPDNLINLILEIESDNRKKNEVLEIQREWLDKHLGKSLPVIVDNQSTDLAEEPLKLTRLKFFTIRTRALFTNLFNTYKL